MSRIDWCRASFAWLHFGSSIWLAAINNDDETMRECLGLTGVVLCVFSLLYSGFWRIQMSPSRLSNCQNSSNGKLLLVEEFSAEGLENFMKPPDLSSMQRDEIPLRHSVNTQVP
ncbi:hypothetical protein SO802_031186 [Lithocarpus litseifolius]|uniref:Uncharacterized protein n=1 Tax=Lithocarpus litseifolius TaxID=425828 RepID=A0AAW2BQD8_9ROSI